MISARKFPITMIDLKFLVMLVVVRNHNSQVMKYIYSFSPDQNRIIPFPRASFGLGMNSKRS